MLDVRLSAHGRTPHVNAPDGDGVITLSAAIMAHPKRRAFVPELLDWLGDPTIPVIYDRKSDRWDTGRRSMLCTAR